MCLNQRYHKAAILNTSFSHKWFGACHMLISKTFPFKNFQL
ncbi:hypothetical protein SLEP1_g49172 [Rubroshorea leprosula]|uniref:Uncharacterized protein n=1 Tax=Rubroshorea leprosula TaxID=152421 RepID=A0AAV5LWZ1_9ROSI|nr:hypothetical protein SLEP1_g49172 [Rubroshorea leprosula]